MAVELIQCVPNFSEGRDETVMSALQEVVRATPGVVFVDRHTDPDHNRMVLTFLGDAEGVANASLALAREAVARIDLTRHLGQHPRIGAMDVVPFVPVGSTPMETCVRVAREVGRTLAAELELPVYFYEEAATRPERRNLALVRGGGFEVLRAAPLMGERAPDVGPSQVHPTAGAVAVGARGPLLAYNVNLHTRDVALARKIARNVRERDGGLVGVKALGLWLDTQGQAQVSLNITRPAHVPLYRVFELVKLEAARYGVVVSGSELIGAIRLEEALEVVRYYLGLHELKATQVLDMWVARLEGERGENDG